MVINLTRVLAGAILFTSLATVPYAPLYAWWGITGGTTMGSDIKKENNYNITQRRNLTKREAYKILKIIDPTPFNAGTRSIKILEYYGQKKINVYPQARGGLLDGSIIRHKKIR